MCVAVILNKIPIFKSWFSVKFLLFFRFWLLFGGLLIIVSAVSCKQIGKRPKNLQESKVYNIKVQFDPEVIFKSLNEASAENIDVEDFINNFKSLPSTTSSNETKTTTTTTTTTSTTLSTTVSPSTSTTSTTDSSIVSVTLSSDSSTKKDVSVIPKESLSPATIEDLHSSVTTSFDTVNDVLTQGKVH